MIQQIKPIGVIVSPFREKFGLPRQPGLAPIKMSIKFYCPYNRPDCFRGLTEYTHIWIIWGFHKNRQEDFHALVRPPRLGGNKKIGVFATRSPFRPNPLGLSVVMIDNIKHDNNETTIEIVGGDFADETPVFDIKPYLTYSDSIPQAKSGFADQASLNSLTVDFSENAMKAILNKMPEEEIEVIRKLIELDPRPAYQADERVYGMSYKSFNIRFRVSGDRALVESINEGN